MIIAALSMLGLGMLFALALGIANMKLHVEDDPRVTQVDDALPGVDCGACGFASCHAYAEGVVLEGQEVNLCVPGGGEVAKLLADLMGVEPLTVGYKIAVVHCGANQSTRKRKGDYQGISTCLASSITTGGDVACPYGCLGLADCVVACPFDAIEMVDGLPTVFPEKCTACGKCVTACPRDLISIRDYDPEKGLVAVACSSRDKGKDVKQVCPLGCIGCMICVKKGPEGVFSVADNLSSMDYEKFEGTEQCQDIIQKCPTNCIIEIPTRNE